MRTTRTGKIGLKRFEQTAQAVAYGALAAFEGTARLRSAVAEKVGGER